MWPPVPGVAYRDGADQQNASQASLPGRITVRTQDGQPHLATVAAIGKLGVSLTRTRLTMTITALSQTTPALRTTRFPRRSGCQQSRGYLTLQPREAAQLQRAAERITADPSADDVLFCAQAKMEAARAPRRLTAAIAAFKASGGHGGTLLIGGLPVGAVPATPLDNRQHLAEETTFARMQAIVNSMLGDMVAYEAEGAGRLFQDMVPNPALAERQQSQSSKVELECHTEQAFSPLCPDWISLGCLRGDASAATYSMSVRTLVEALSPCVIAGLREELWMTDVDESFQGAHGFDEDVRGPMAILRGSADDPRLVFDQAMSAITPDAQAILQEIIDLYPDLRHEHILKPGELLLIDNHRAVHGRSSFTARYDGADRFIARSFVVADLAVSEHARPAGSRTIAARFS
jgi:L-asparagine oxygenase